MIDIILFVIMSCFFSIILGTIIFFMNMIITSSII